MSDLSKIQHAVGTTLLPGVRAVQCAPLREVEALAITLELYYAAFAMKTAYRRGGCLVAAQYASRVGLDPDCVEAFALDQLQQALDAAE